MQAYEDACCDKCGGFLPDTTAPESEDSYRVEAARCHRCTAIAQRSGDYHESPHPHALLYRVERR